MRTILHSDLNNFFASVEIAHNPSLADKFIAVTGSTESRHGIVLAKNEKAKKMGVKTGKVIWQAKQKCPELLCVPPHYDWYFQSTPSVWRETYTYRGTQPLKVFQSTPSVWRETRDTYRGAAFTLISIHSLRVEGDIISII